MKRILIAGLVMLAAGVAQAEYLYWQVSKSDDSLVAAVSEYNDKWKVAPTIGVTDLSSIRFVAEDASTHEATTLLTTSRFDQDIAIDITQYTGNNYFYYVEVLSDASGIPYEKVARTSQTQTPMTYQEAVSKGYVYEGSDLSVPSLNVWTGGSFSAAPEPTSGLLLLIGVGLLGLKRKRA